MDLLFSSLAAGPLSYEQVTVFLLAFGVLLGAARLLGELARRFGQPTVLGEILAGVLLGATMLGNPAFFGEDGWNVRAYQWLFPTYVLNEEGEPVLMKRLSVDEQGHAEISDKPDDPEEQIVVVDKEELKATDSVPLPTDHEKAYDGGFLSMTMFLNLSAVFLLLVAGLEVDLSVVWKQGKAALWVSLMGMILPFAVGFGLAYALPGTIGFDFESGQKFPFALFVGIAMSITALPVIAKILMDLNMFRSDMGMLIMSSAMVNDLLGWIGFAMVLALVATTVDGGGGGGDAGAGLLVTIGWTLLFVGGMLTVGRWLIDRILPFIQAHTSWPGGPLGFVLSLSLICAAATEAIGIHSIFGAFIAGVAIGDSKHLRGRTRETIEQFISYIFAPLFFAGIGLRVNFIDGFDFWAVAIVLVVAIFGKVIGCYLGAIWAGLSRRESAAIGMGMSARGAMEIILAQLALSHHLITEKLFVAIVVMAIATSLIAGPAMQAVLRRKQKRRLADVISERTYAGRLKARTRREAIDEMAVVAAEATDLDATMIANAVWRREQMMSTGLPGGIAVPHARLRDLTKPVVVIGQSLDGIDFDSSDGRPSQIFCLILTPQGEGETQIEMLAAVADAFTSSEAQQHALEAENYTQFKAALVTTAAPAHE